TAKDRGGMAEEKVCAEERPRRRSLRRLRLAVGQQSKEFQQRGGPREDPLVTENGGNLLEARVVYRFDRQAGLHEAVHRPLPLPRPPRPWDFRRRQVTIHHPLGRRTRSFARLASRARPSKIPQELQTPPLRLGMPLLHLEPGPSLLRGLPFLHILGHLL